MNRNICVADTHHRDHTAGAHAVVESHPVLVVWVVALPQEVLIPREVWFLVEHPVTAVNSDGVAAAEVGVQLGALAAALIGAAQEFFVFVKDDLDPKQLRDKEKKVWMVVR